MGESQRWQVNLLIRTLALRHKGRAGTALARIGLFPGQETVLMVLDRFGPMTQRQLVDHLGVEPPTLSTVARKLETGDFVSRTPCPTDARAMVVDLTDKGRALLPEIRRIGRDLAETTLAGMDGETVRVLMETLQRAIENLDEKCPTHD